MKGWSPFEYGTTLSTWQQCLSASRARDPCTPHSTTLTLPPAVEVQPAALRLVCLPPPLPNHHYHPTRGCELQQLGGQHMALSIMSLEVKKRERCEAQPSSLDTIWKRNETHQVWLTLDLQCRVLFLTLANWEICFIFPLRQSWNRITFKKLRFFWGGDVWMADKVKGHISVGMCQFV